MKIRRYVLNRIHRAGGKALQLPTAQELAKGFPETVSAPGTGKAVRVQSAHRQQGDENFDR